MLSYIKAKREVIVSGVYPDIPDEFVDVKTIYTHPNGTKELGHIVRHGNTALIHGWHGDIGFLINGKDFGKKAIIFEIKFGHIHVTPGQREFFDDIIKNPSKYMKHLDEVKVFLVHCVNFDLEHETMKVSFKVWKG